MYIRSCYGKKAVLGMLEIVNVILTSAIGAVVSWTAHSLINFRHEQTIANRATEMANRSMQRDVLYRYYRLVVEQGIHITPEEYSHVQECYEAYYANGGNSSETVMTVMFKKIRDLAVIETGRS